MLKITMNNTSKINNSVGEGIKIYRLFKGKISNLDEFLNSQEGNNKFQLKAKNYQSFFSSNFV